ncbi:SDR family oxidoreductase [Tessaracoccus sp. MC1865]|uniref:SDR family NAD(P)-dependent oxidoreductase n=1 Tax=Tessaracoccus sp. MC1865 TaxID=2760310 RepID=UPI001602144F|nr:SDR family NAD(P)-dependent oxidoreductase [Tessaracoccus sp. MC1865]MBB1482607.1 SDR family oxidoreductase [Tessaracoccus sp. MC1865]QTO37941.1 SDR family oxidoreductase [Tessaracoccus sp. MC1865]
MIIVTGGAGSIGSVICRRLADRGFTLVVADANTSQAKMTAEGLGERHSFFGGDLTSEDTNAALVDHAVARGTLVGVVNGLGISPKHPDGKLEIGEISAEDFMRVMAVNALAPFLLSKLAFRRMPDDGSASIVNILSITTRMASGGLRTAQFPPLISSASHYGASKAALHNLQTTMAREFASRRVRVNGVAPGFIATDMTRTISDDERSRVLRQVPWGRAGRPEDVAAAVDFLMGPDAAYCTGAVLDVNGGWLPA